MSDRFNPTMRAAWLAASVGLVGTSLLAGCAPESKPQSTTQQGDAKAGAPVETTEAANKTVSQAPAQADYAKANELGLVPVLEYHRFDVKEERWTRTYANFKKDLEFLYNNNYVLVNMRDMAERKIEIPAGKKPVVLTFDDATEGQFRFLKDAKGQIKRDAAGKPVIDPNCAVGIIDAFSASHPGFGPAGTFYVLPSGFEQDAAIAEKFKYLAANGYEIGSHTWGHDNLSTLSAPAITKSLTKLQAFISQQVGKPYEVKTLALPYGIGPRSAGDLQAVVKGGSGDGAYHHKALLLVGANPAVSPYDKAYKATAVARIQAIDDEFKRWFNRKPGAVAKVTEPWYPYVSDGDPAKVTFPEAAKAKFDPKSLAPGQQANPFDPKKAAKVADATETADRPKAESPAPSPETGDVAAASASPAASAAPVAQALDVHPGYNNAKLPAGSKYQDGKITHVVAAGDSVEAIAWKHLRYTDYYTYPKLASAIRSVNNANRPLKIGETLVIPKVRQAPPMPKLVKRDKTFTAKGVYVTGTTAGSEAVWDLIKDLKAHGGNTIVFDAKDMNGKMSYDTQVPLAKQIKAFDGDMITNLPKFIERVHAEGIHCVARVALFHDDRLAMRKPQYALKSKRTGGVWREQGSLAWVDPSLKEVQDYQLAIFKELIAAGVDEIQYDYVRFPAQGDTPDIKWSTMGTQKAKSEVITAWVKRAHEELKSTGVLISADVYGVVAWDQGIDVRITGQNLTEMAPYLDALSPMLYPSHFYGTFDKKTYPPDHPAYFVGEGVKRVGKKTEGSGVVIRPWLQAFPYRIRNYGPGYVATQITAGDAAGGNGWLLWNAENSYKVGFAGVSAAQKGQKQAAR
jgi:peptidoglycan/xylan/chitin deacetylase (PgdA/CDA1 family)